MEMETEAAHASRTSAPDKAQKLYSPYFVALLELATTLRLDDSPHCQTGLSLWRPRFSVCSDFTTKAQYEGYVKKVLRPGTTVVLLEDFECVPAGAVGTVLTISGARRSAGGTASDEQGGSASTPAQVEWRSFGQSSVEVRLWMPWRLLAAVAAGEQTEDDYRGERTEAQAPRLANLLEISRREVTRSLSLIQPGCHPG